MHRPSLKVFLFLLLAGPVTAVLGQAVPGPSSGLVSNRYEIRFLDTHAAELLAWEQCRDKDRCLVSSLLETSEKSSRRLLEVRADSATHERIVQALAREDAAPKTRTFQAVLVLADDKPEAREPALTPEARKALGDLRGFLPFKSYHVLDSVWLRTTRSVQGRLVGSEDAAYTINLEFRNVGKIEEDNLYVDHFRLEEDGSRPEPGGGRRGPRQLIRTSFGMKEGETIVVGTSKLDGGQEALVLLLTAVP